MDLSAITFPGLLIFLLLLVVATFWRQNQQSDSLSLGFTANPESNKITGARQENNTLATNIPAFDSESLKAQRKIELLGLTNLVLQYHIPDFGFMISRRLKRRPDKVLPEQISDELQNLSKADDHTIFLFLVAILVTVCVSAMALKHYLWTVVIALPLPVIYLGILRLTPTAILFGHRGLRFQFRLGPLCITSSELLWQQLVQIKSGQYFCTVSAPVTDHDMHYQIVLPDYEVQAVELTFAHLQPLQCIGCAGFYLALSAYWDKKGITIPLRLDSIPQENQLKILRELVAEPEHQLNGEKKMTED